MVQEFRIVFFTTFLNSISQELEVFRIIYKFFCSRLEILNMAENTQPSHSAERTFRAYDSDQGAAYAQHRRNYSPELYQAVLDYHKSRGGQFDTILDVGCGPGMAVRSLAPYFVHAIGIDPSEGMIHTARSLDDSSSEKDSLRFEVSAAEELGATLSPPFQNGSIDLITASTAAHWFDMPRFWLRAAEVLKSGGTVALWCGGTIRVDPSMPNHTSIQAVIDELDDSLAEHMLPGNILSRDMYRGMPLPWTLETPVSEFEEASFVRKEWNTGPGSESTNFYAQNQPIPIKMLEAVLGTASPVTRWREANPDAVGTESDIVRVTRRRVEQILRDGGVEEGKELLKGDVTGVLLMVKTRSGEN